MKILNIILCLLLFYNVNGQISGINVIKENSDNWHYRSYIQDSIVFILSKDLIFINWSKPDKITRIVAPISNYDFFSPIYSKIINDNHINITWLAYRNDSTFIYTFEHNIKTKEFVLIDTIIIEGNSSNYYITKAKQFDDNMFACITIFKQVADQICLIKITENGRITKLALVKKDSSPVNNKLFAHRFINDIEIINNNKFILTGDNPIVSIVDSSLNIINRSFPKFELPAPIYYLNLFRTNLISFGSNEFKAISSYPYYNNNIEQTIVYKLKIDSDSIIIDTFTIISNIEKFSKFENYITNASNNTFYTASNPDFQIPSLKGNIPCSFYITKFVDQKEIWHKSFGGDYYYRVWDIQTIDSCKLIVLGSIFDYYKNGFVQGFYSFIDCDGNLIASDIDLIENKINLTLFPNPISNTLNLNFDQPLTGNIIIYNNIGQKLLTEKIINIKYVNIDMSKFPNGHYNIQFLNKRIAVTKKFIKLN